MSILDGQRVIAIEEHYYDQNVTAHFEGTDAKTGGFVREQLEEVGAARIKSMDEAGIDVQVLSHGAPSTQKLDAELGPRVAAAANDRLKEICDAYPDRLAGFAALDTADPIAAANELERAVDKLGFKGAMIHGLTGGELFIDDRRFWPIFERAQALDVPLYLHPALPHMFGVNVFGMVAMLQAFVPVMEERGSGYAINLSSTWGRHAAALQSPYCATKFAVEALSQALAQEVAPGVAVVSVNPGVVATDMLATCFGGDVSGATPPEECAASLVRMMERMDPSWNGRSLDAADY